MGGNESKNIKKRRSSSEEGGRIDEEMWKESARVFAFKEAEWKQEKKKMREEVKMLRSMVEEKDKKIRVIEEEKSGGEEYWQVLLGSRNAATLLVEQMREERARRDETVDKWKQLYLAIKKELDHLIQTTHSGTGVYWRAEEEEDVIVEELKGRLKAKEEMIARLNNKIAAMENEQFKREREIDILRQSLRIMSYKKTLVQVAKDVKTHTRKPC